MFAFFLVNKFASNFSIDFTFFVGWGMSMYTFIFVQLFFFLGNEVNTFKSDSQLIYLIQKGKALYAECHI
jgi:hypothetical protein